MRGGESQYLILVHEHKRGEGRGERGEGRGFERERIPKCGFSFSMKSYAAFSDSFLADMYAEKSAPGSVGLMASAASYVTGFQSFSLYTWCGSR